MALPMLAPVPPVELLRQLLPGELQQYVEVWLALVSHHLKLDDGSFQERGESIAAFLTSYFNAMSSSGLAEIQPMLKLKQQAFILSHRVMSLHDVPESLLQWNFLADVSRQYMHSPSLEQLLQSVWRRKQDTIISSIEAAKRDVIAASPSVAHEPSSRMRSRLAPLLQTLPDVGEVILTGSDFLDALLDSFGQTSGEPRKATTLIVYLSLISLVREEKHNVSLLYDQIYALKADASKRPDTSLIGAVVSDTPLLTRLLTSPILRGNQRTLELIESLRQMRRSSTRPKKIKRAKGKERVAFENGDNIGSIHGHRMNLISQIHDLFPDLGTAFIAKLLSQYDDDVETATSHLLEDSLPEALKIADRTEQLMDPDGNMDRPDFTPAPTPPPHERRNVFDDDEFDRLRVDASKLHVGKKEVEHGDAPNKAAILSALAAFDSDDDERDDTYDIEDVGGTVDTSNPEADGVGVDDQKEEALFRAYKMDPGVFDRDAATRRGKLRTALKSETGLTDEAIEGWLLINTRDPRKMRRLEAKYNTWGGQQRELGSTAWRESPTGSGADEPNDGHGAPRGRGGGRPRSRGGFRGRGDVAGSANERDTQQARQRKEASKGSRANHNRRDQRARKMARGGL